MVDHASPLHVLLPAAADAVELGLRALLAGAPRFAVAGDPGPALVLQARRLGPELIVLDPEVDDHWDLELLRALTKVAPASRVCVYTNYFECQGFVDAFRAGARGYLLKRARRSPASLLDFLSSVGHGNLGIDAAIMTQLLRPDTATVLVSVLPAQLHLNGRERAVLAGLFAGQSEVEIAGTLDISLRTVRRTIEGKLLPKFQARNLRELLIKAAELGLNR